MFGLFLATAIDMLGILAAVLESNIRYTVNKHMIGLVHSKLTLFGRSNNNCLNSLI